MSRMSGAAAAVLLIAGLTTAARAQSPTQAPQPLKLAFINSNVILQSTPGRAQAESTFQHDFAGYQQQVNVLQAQFDSAVNEFQRTSLVLSPSAKQQRQNELSQMRDRTTQQIQDLNDRARQREQELLAPIYARVNTVVEAIRVEFNYAMVFDAAAQGGSLVTADHSLDISPLVIQRLQALGGAPTPGAVQPSPTPPLAQPADTAAPANPPAGQSARPARPRPPRP